MKIIILILSLLLLLAGCAPIVFPTFLATFPPGKDNKDVMSAIVMTLAENDISVSVINTDVGMITTEPFLVTPNSEQAFNVFLTGLPFKQTMKLTIIVDQAKNQIMIKPYKQQQGQYGWQDISLDEGDEDLIHELKSSIAKKIGATPATGGTPNDTKWNSKF